MQVNQEIFLYVAEELSISKAAKRAFVSQQCVSDHINRLEKNYGVKLFTRKPFALTEAGISLMNSLQKIKVIESSTNETIRQHATGERGRFTVGIGASRAQIILPEIMPLYNSLFPKVEVLFLNNDTMILEDNLRKGYVDLFLGVNPPYKKDLSYIHVCDDNLCICISEGLLNQSFPEIKKELLKGVSNLKVFEHVPFIKSYSTSVVNRLLQDCMDAHHVELLLTYQLSDTDTPIALCPKGLGAIVSSDMLLSHISSHNRICRKNELIHVIPIYSFAKPLRLEIVSMLDAEKPLYILEFEKLLINTLLQKIKKH